MAVPQVDKGYVEFRIYNDEGKLVDLVDAGTDDEVFPKAILVHRKHNKAVKTLGLPTHKNFGSGVWVLVCNLLEEIDLTARTAA